MGFSANLSYFSVAFSVDYRAMKVENFMFEKNCYFMIFFQEKVSSFDLYQCMNLTIVLLTRLHNHSHLEGKYSRWCNLVSKWWFIYENP